ncbi:MAG: cache domain-containing protein [Desulfuromonadaceae bacterium]|nr:cache domain-containing protein [Desulfuromonadaceae bacterium]MDD2848840.1 cache domain-containing protein [Desulfuromonadaceae bacterium]MDD4132203.1 cache domain-containing protein [Desulfuromonadaceae bacterium]
MKWLQSLPIQILILFLMLLMAFPAIGLIIHSGFQGRESDLESSARSSTYLLNSIASELQSKVEASRQFMGILSLLPEVRQRRSAPVNSLLADLLQRNPIYTNILMVDRSGVTWAGKTPGNKPINLADRKAFRDAMATGLFSPGEYVVGKATQKQILNFALPLKNSNGETDGAILFGLDLEQIGAMLKVDRMPAGTSFGIFDHNGVFIYRTVSPDKFIGKRDRQQTFDQMTNGPDEGVMDLVSNDGIHRLAAYRKVRLSKDQPPYAYIRGGTPVETTLKAANAALTQNVLIMTAILALVFALNFFISRRLIVDRIVTLQEASRRLASGNLQVRIDEIGEGGELGKLGAAFDEMAAALANNMAERSLKEEALKEKSELLDLAHDAIILRDLDGKVLFWNNGAMDMYGYSSDEVTGRVIHDLLGTLFPKPISAIMKDNILTTGRWEGKLIHTAYDGRGIIVNSRWVLQRDRNNNPWRIMEINSDITDRENAQNELLRMQKLESLGVLAGGIAHDFNNILTGIMGNISLAGMALQEPDKAKKLLLQAEQASQRASELAYQLLTFARGSKPVKKAVNARILIEETTSLVLHGSNVLGKISIPADLHAIEVDEGQIHQAFHNIIINAVQAMPEGGTISISAENVSLVGDTPSSLPAGEYVRFTFSDTGPGISVDNQKNIFDPYFTTKSGGKGIGLASTHSIITKHGGYIAVHSEVGTGTTFEILLPASEQQAAEPETGVTALPSTAQNEISVLVMDDEMMIRDLMAEMLAELGYSVTTCSHGDAAVELYTAAIQEGNPFSAVIMDLTIPGGTGGKEAARLILDVDPKACLIVSSGYSNDPVMADFADYGFSATMVKPYRISKVAEVMNRLKEQTRMRR